MQGLSETGLSLISLFSFPKEGPSLFLQVKKGNRIKPTTFQEGGEADVIELELFGKSNSTLQIGAKVKGTFNDES